MRNMFNKPPIDTLQLSGVEDVWLYEGGSISFHNGDTEVYFDNPNFTLTLLMWLEEHKEYLEQESNNE